LGYIAVGATTAQSPIIETSTAPAPHHRLATATTVAENRGYKKAQVRFVHGGPGLFVAEFKAGSQQPFMVNLGNLHETNKRSLIEPGKPSAEGINHASQQWKRLSEPSSAGDVSIMAVSSKQLVDFPLYVDMDNTAHSGSGCGATAGSAIYWWYAEYKGYDKLRSVIGSYDWVDLADHLYEDMNSARWGTSSTSWADGMRIHANTHAGYKFTTQSVDSKANDYYTTFKSEINAGRPTGVYIGLTVGVDDDFEYHIMATYGYYHDTNVGIREVDVATGWGYESSFDYDYYRTYYPFSFMWVKPG
jgi:hypothetical protein